MNASTACHCLPPRSLSLQVSGQFCAHFLGGACGSAGSRAECKPATSKAVGMMRALRENEIFGNEDTGRDYRGRRLLWDLEGFPQNQ